MFLWMFRRYWWTVLLSVPVLLYLRISTFTLLPHLRNATPIEGLVTGDYNCHLSDSDLGGPFSLDGKWNEIRIIQEKMSVVVYGRLSASPWERLYTFSGNDFGWFDGDTLIYRSDAVGRASPILPGYAVSKLEGWIRVMPNGELKIEEAFWEYGMVFFVFPFYDEARTHYRLTAMSDHDK